MGTVKTSELANGNIGLEITYGGADALFGGVDTSAPPAYIDPRCFTSSDGAIVANNKLCAVALENVATPTLWSGTVGVKLIGFGTFYNSIWGQLNYALGYISTPIVGPPTGVQYTFYITSWIPGNIGTFYNDVLPVSLYDSYTPAVAASLTIPCLASSSVSAGAGSGATGSITAVSTGGFVTAATLAGGTGYGIGDAVQMVPSGYVPDDYGWLIVDTVGGGGSISTTHLATNVGFVYSVGPITAGDVEVPSTTKLRIVSTAGTNDYTANAYGPAVTAGSIVASFAASISASNPDVVGAASADGLSLVITAIIPGVGGNAFTAQDLSTAAAAGQPPPFYFPAASATNLIGGLDASAAPAAQTLQPVSSTDVGGTLYIANLGPMILKYSGPGLFAISSMYEGISVLRKFGGSLIGAGVSPKLGFELKNQDMIFAWTAANKLDEWSPIDSGGNITGAGFEQLADIGDFLSGLIVSNGTCYILREQGVSYASVTGNATLPFSINHIGLGEQGEGTQVPSLVAQYDSVGCYVGNSDVWQISGGISAVGQKIKSLIFAALQNTGSGLLSSAAGAVYIGGQEYPIAVFLIGVNLYIFNTLNGTWTTLSYYTGPKHPVTFTLDRAYCSNFASSVVTPASSKYNQNLVAVATQVKHTGVLQPPSFFVFAERLSDDLSVSNTFSVQFPQEECSFGRDVTIDALYVAVQAKLQSNITMNVYINNVLYAAYTLLASSFVDVEAVPTQFQIFPSSAGIKTGPSPQLRIDLINAAGTQNSQIRFTKIAMFGSIDPRQRPV